jgi:quinoprotein glucose dehydrogenase
MAWILTMVDAKKKLATNETNLEAGQRLYANTCMRCHGANMEGSGNIPPLTDINKKYSEQQVIDLITTGRRMMPAMSQLAESEKKAITSFITDNKKEQKEKFTTPVRKDDEYNNLLYTGTGYNKFLTKERYPAIAPPWGTLNAIDLNKAETVWKIPLGEYPELKARGIPATGTENYGGPVVTAGGLLFIAASRDGKFRAFNKRTGKLLWETDLPAPGFATPSVYSIGGKQYIVIACGGGKLGTRSGDAYVAFSL